MNALQRILLSSPRLVVYDSFGRADSALTLGPADTGQVWTTVTGTAGITGYAAYFPSDTSGDITLIEGGSPNGVLTAIVNGDLTTASSNFSIPQLILRALNSSNCLRASLSDSTAIISKVDGGSISTLASGSAVTADNTDYTIEVVCDGPVVALYQNGVLRANHTLTGTDMKYAGYTQYGMRLGRAGTPSFPARWKRFAFTAR